ncbi:dynein axonemal intermediate chain 7 isoform X2 [Tribolium castaneum]|uniref:dynein axonemal intermediate chain 7 isoform X2 n=1 Tax=Tribolium castaneum TaxID=7070 RepID=UPI00077DBA5E|nr:PREDICTED: protein CASC1-like isoform X2 [Tribolium castaneum]|eukprot:XP_015837771.1 PREDICTED: protein CASC1-like isoform X2 [Tribolium castaneum]
MAKGKAKNKKLETTAATSEPGLEQVAVEKSEDQIIEEKQPVNEEQAEPPDEPQQKEEQPETVPDFEELEADASKPDIKRASSRKVSKGKKGTSEISVGKKKGKKEKKSTSETSVGKKGKKKKGKKGKDDVQTVEQQQPAEETEEVDKLPLVIKAVSITEASALRESKVRIDKSASAVSTDEEESKKEKKAKKGRSTSTISVGDEKKKKKGRSTSSIGVGDGKKKKKKKGKKSTSTSQMSVTGKKKKKLKKSEESRENIKPTVSISAAAIAHKKKKAKGKKMKRTASVPSATMLTQEGGKHLPTASEVSLRKKDKKSSASLRKVKSSGSQLIGKSLSAILSRSKSSERRTSSQWTLVDDESEEDSDYSYEDIIEESVLAKSSSRFKPKVKKGKGKKKGKKVQMEVGEEEEPKEKKKKKGKKGKKKKVEPEEEEVAIEPQDDVLAEIARLKYLAELEASGEESEAATTETEAKPKKKKKKKKGPKKKLSKKEKARLAAEAAEKAKISAEEEAARAAELERIRLEEERKAAIEKEKRETFEQQIRMEQLEVALQYINDVVRYNKKLRHDAKVQEDWEFYVNCGRLPNPAKCDQMNTFLHLWENVIEQTTMEEAAKRTVDMLELLNELDDLIDTAEETDQSVIDNWKWVRLLFRQQQAKSLDVATYRLLRDIERNLHRIDIPTADYKYQDDNIVLCLWLRVQLPTPLPNPRRPPKPRIEVNFPEMKMEVQFPVSIDGDKMAVRTLYVKYDHLSDLCDTYQKPEVPERYDIDLYDAMKLEWWEKLLYKFKHRVRKEPPPPPPGEEDQPVVQPEEPIFGPEDEIPVVPYRKLEPTASEYVIASEDALYSETRTNLLKSVTDDVINLRKFSIIGGVYSLNLLKQPPQPQDFVTLDLNLTPLYLPKQLEYVDLYLDYNPPLPPPPGVRKAPEEIEEDMKRQEEELDKLIFVTLTWPDHVIFLELPMVCYWDDERRVWTKSEVHDLKHNEEKGQLTFRTRKGGTFALAVYRYANLPYQAWEIRPEANGTISVQITAAILMVEFNVKDGLIALSQLQNSPNNALQDIVGTYFPLPKLMLQSAGVDVFPAFDAFCYIENTCEKHWPMEKHLYFDMALLSVCFNFAWSRWNMAAGRRGIVLQMREYNVEKTKQKNHSMLHVTPLTAMFVDCTEVSQTFTEEGIENMKFYPDLYHLMKGTSSMAVKNKVIKASKELTFALYELLVATRVASFS